MMEFRIPGEFWGRHAYYDESLEAARLQMSRKEAKSVPGPAYQSEARKR